MSRFAFVLSAFQRIARGGRAGFARVALVAEARFEIALDPYPQLQFGSLGRGAFGFGAGAGCGVLEFGRFTFGAEFDRTFVVGGRPVAVAFGGSAIRSGKALRRAQTRGAFFRLISCGERARFGFQHGVEPPFQIDPRTDLFGMAAALLARAVVEAAVFFAQARQFELGCGRAFARSRMCGGRAFGQTGGFGELALEPY